MSMNPTTVPRATPVASPSPVLRASLSVGSQLLSPGGRASRTLFQEDISQEAGSILKTEQSPDPSCWGGEGWLWDRSYSPPTGHRELERSTDGLSPGVMGQGKIQSAFR